MQEVSFEYLFPFWLPLISLGVLKSRALQLYSVAEIINISFILLKFANDNVMIYCKERIEVNYIWEFKGYSANTLTKVTQKRFLANWPISSECQNNKNCRKFIASLMCSFLRSIIFRKSIVSMRLWCFLVLSFMEFCLGALIDYWGAL